MPGEALGQSRVGTRPLYSSESPSPPLPTAQPCISLPSPSGAAGGRGVLATSSIPRGPGRAQTAHRREAQLVAFLQVWR